MADLISEVIDLQVFEQVKKLTADLETLYGVMDKTIALGAGNNKIIDPQGMKAATDATNNLNTTVTKLMETESERLNIEVKLKENEAKMAASIKVSTDAIDKAKQIWKSFALGNEELADRIAEATLKLEEQKKLLKDSKNASNYKDVLASTTIVQAKLKAEISEYTKEMKRNIQQMDVSEDSIKSMSILLAQATDQFNRLSEEERNSEFGQQFQDGINQLDTKLKGLEGSIGNYKRMVGGYLIVGESMRSQLREIVQALAEEKFKMDSANDAIREQQNEVNRLANTLGKNSQEYIDANAKLNSMTLGLQKAKAAMSELEREGGKIQDAMGDAKTAIKGMADDAGNTAALSQGVGVLADSFSVFQAGMVAVGADGEDLMKIYAKMMILQQGFNSLTQITNALEDESLLRLKLKNLWAKISLAFTQKKTAATIKETAATTVNTASTTASAVATEGLAAAETTATATSVGLSAAIKSIPGIGWILGIAAALGTLAVILYKVISAQKELNVTQLQNKKLREDIGEITQETNQNTLETIYKTKLYVSELGKVKKGSKEWKDIVNNINDLTGLQLDSIKNSKIEIEKATNLWINQYKIRANAEARIQKIVKNQLDFEQLSYDIQTSTADNRRELIDSLMLSEPQKSSLLYWLNVGKSTVKDTQMNKDAWAKVMNYINIARKGVEENNKKLEEGITLEGLITDEKKKGVDKDKESVENKKAKTEEQQKEYEMEKILSKMRFIASEQEKAIINEKIRLLKEQQAADIKNDPTNEANIIKAYQLEIAKVTQEGANNIIAIEQNKNDALRDLVDERLAMFKDEKDVISKAGKDYAGMVSKLSNADNIDESEKQAAAITDITNSVVGLGETKAQYIKDEKQRVKVEQGLALVQVLITQGIVLAQMSLAQIKADPYTYVPRLVAAAAAIVGTFITAINSIKQANAVSAYAEGTDYHKGGAAIVGEGGQPELVTIGSRQTWITEPTFIPNLPVGASVTPLEDYKQETESSYWLEKLYNKEGSQFNINLSDRILPTLIKEGKVIRFANKIITARS